MDIAQKNRVRYGTVQEVKEGRRLQVGALSMWYTNGFLRYIKYGDVEVLRMINHAVRDHNWNTFSLQIEEEEITQTADQFTVRYTALAEQQLADSDRIRYQWKVLIEGNNQTLTFEIKGRALSTFQRNRIGFTVLHPIENTQGKAVQITHSDGQQKTYEFPHFISPHQPFFDIRAMQWQPAEHLEANLQFEGDIFECEDQRNWIDHSYKTYCTPLDLPFPVKVEAGDEVWQRIQLTIDASDQTITNRSETPLTCSIVAGNFVLPKLGLQLGRAFDLWSDRSTALLQGLEVNHYQMDWRTNEDGEKAKVLIKQLGKPIGIHLFLEEEATHLHQFIDTMRAERDNISYISVLSAQAVVSPLNLLEVAIPTLKKQFPDPPIGAGTTAYFTALNRTRITTSLPDFLTYSINPQVHAFDHLSLIENIEALPHTVQSARQYAATSCIHISPITLKPQWNPAATGDTGISFANKIDPRQYSLFGAAWTLGILNQLVTSRVDTATFYETHGELGIVAGTRSVFEWSEEVASPIYFVVKLIGSATSCAPLRVSNPLKFSGLVVDHQLLLTNFTSQKIRIQLPTSFHFGRAQYVTDENVSELMHKPEHLEQLTPFSIAETIDLPPLALAIITPSNTIA